MQKISRGGLQEGFESNLTALREPCNLEIFFRIAPHYRLGRNPCSILLAAPFPYAVSWAIRQSLLFGRAQATYVGMDPAGSSRNFLYLHFLLLGVCWVEEGEEHHFWSPISPALLKLGRKFLWCGDEWHTDCELFVTLANAFSGFL